MPFMPMQPPSQDSPVPPRIHLIGYRGTGKSAVAQALALRLGWDWVDADVELELARGQVDRGHFCRGWRRGVSRFGKCDAGRVGSAGRRVLATGGGVVLRAENRELLRSGATVVWLKATPETILRRLSEDWTTVSRRPNLTTGGLDEICDILEKRTPLYRQCADLEVETDDKTIAEVAAEIIVQLGM